MELKNLETNQNVVIEQEEKTFFSYGQEIAIFKNGTLKLKKDMWNYSKTTAKYFKIFINDFTNFNYTNRKNFEKEIKNNKNIIID